MRWVINAVPMPWAAEHAPLWLSMLLCRPIQVSGWVQMWLHVESERLRCAAQPLGVPPPRMHACMPPEQAQQSRMQNINHWGVDCMALLPVAAPHTPCYKQHCTLSTCCVRNSLCRQANTSQPWHQSQASIWPSSAGSTLFIGTAASWSRTPLGKQRATWQAAHMWPAPGGTTPARRTGAAPPHVAGLQEQGRQQGAVGVVPAVLEGRECVCR